MAPNPLPALAQLQLHLSPAPRNINESRAILRTLQKFGEIIMFKVLRYEETTKDLTPKAHVIFKSETVARDVLAASPITVPSTNITVIPSESIFKHPQYISYASAAHYVKDQSFIRRRGGPMENIDVQIEDSPIRFGSEQGLSPSTQMREMRSRLIRRYTGEFIGFKDLQERIAWEKEQKDLLREENEKLARGELVGFSGGSAEKIQRDQLDTIQDILGDLKEEEKRRGEEKRGDEEKEGKEGEEEEKGKEEEAKEKLDNNR